MQLTVHSYELREAFNKILSVVDKKNSRAILTYALIEAQSDKLQISATDLEVSARIILDARVATPGTYCVNAKNLFDILRELPDTDIDLFLDNTDNSLKLNCNDIHYSLLVHRSDDYPRLVFDNNDTSFHLKAFSVLEIISKTSHAISMDETRINLNGIFLQEVNSKLRSVATDGYKFALLDTELRDNNIEALINGIIVPKKGVYELRKLAETYPDGEIKLSIDDSFMFASAGERYFLSVRLISREFPNYQVAIPSKTTLKMTADRDALLDAVKRIKIMSNEKSNGIRMNFKDKEVTLVSNHPSLGDATEKIPVEYNGREIEIGFNAKYLIDTFSVLNSGELVLEFNNELSPVIVKSTTLPDFLGIVMPLKV